MLRRWDLCGIFDFLLEQLLKFVLISAEPSTFKEVVMYFNILNSVFGQFSECTSFLKLFSSVPIFVHLIEQVYSNDNIKIIICANLQICY